jgi:phosphoglucosamine mutase
MLAASSRDIIILGDYSTTGDGLLAALQVLAILKQQKEPVSKLCRVFTPVPQILKKRPL